MEILEHYLTESEAEIKSLKDTLDFQNMKTEEVSAASRTYAWGVTYILFWRDSPSIWCRMSYCPHFNVCIFDRLKNF